MENVIRTDCKGEHTVIFTESERDTIMAHMRHKMSYDDRQTLIDDVRGVAHCFDRCGEYALEISIAKAYSHNEVIPAVSKWLASWLRRNHPMTIKDKICGYACPFNI